ncbi:MAG: RES family NAD+ phosphorylase [Prolixibacteraceae bacterium]|nr:RES family NAD+ phosphorylase [Prolixibacteraceae bacterium]
MIVFRLANKKYCNDLSGSGAEMTGGRWNFKGTKLLYTAESRALCMAEIAVHTPVGIMPIDYYLITIEIPDYSNIEQVDPDNLPDNWRKFPYSKTTQELGEKFIEANEYLYIKVPSAVVQGDFNILINPGHSDFNEVRIIQTEKFNFDKRLFK